MVMPTHLVLFFAYSFFFWDLINFLCIWVLILSLSFTMDSFESKCFEIRHNSCWSKKISKELWTYKSRKNLNKFHSSSSSIFLHSSYWETKYLWKIIRMIGFSKIWSTVWCNLISVNDQNMTTFSLLFPFYGNIKSSKSSMSTNESN